MTFRLSNRSLSRLEGVHPDLVDIVKLAITKSACDFGVSCGVRDMETQKRLVKEGRSQTHRSKHLLQDDGFSHAVDLIAYDGAGDICWEHSQYVKVADAMIESAKELGNKIKLGWGNCWHIDNICDHEGNSEDMMDEYIHLRKNVQKRKYFLDAPHFQLN